jgi:trk/ktr system potassium uptake protein
MHVIVVGCGRVGSELAARLQREGHPVAVIDKNANAFRRLPDPWDGIKVVGFGFDRDDLHRAGIERAGAVAAVTSGDNTNILTARIARETFEVEHVVARIYDPRRAAIYQRLGIPTVATVSWTVDQVARRLIPGEVGSAWTDPTGGINLVEFPLPESMCGRPLSEVTDNERFRPVMITRGGQAKLVGPGLVGQEGDIVHFAVRTEALADISAKLARSARPKGADAGAGPAEAAAGGAGGTAGSADASATDDATPAGFRK